MGTIKRNSLESLPCVYYLSITQRGRPSRRKRRRRARASCASMRSVPRWPPTCLPLKAPRSRSRPRRAPGASGTPPRTRSVRSAASTGSPSSAGDLPAAPPCSASASSRRSARAASPPRRTGPRSRYPCPRCRTARPARLSMPGDDSQRRTAFRTDGRGRPPRPGSSRSRRRPGAGRRRGAAQPHPPAGRVAAGRRRGPGPGGGRAGRAGGRRPGGQGQAGGGPPRPRRRKAQAEAKAAEEAEAARRPPRPRPSRSASPSSAGELLAAHLRVHPHLHYGAVRLHVVLRPPHRPRLRRPDRHPGQGRGRREDHLGGLVRRVRLPDRAASSRTARRSGTATSPRCR